MNKEESGGGWGQAGVVVPVRSRGGLGLSCPVLVHLPLQNSAYILASAEEKRWGCFVAGARDNKALSLPVAAAAVCSRSKRAHITRAARIGCIMQSSNEHPLRL